MNSLQSRTEREQKWNSNSFGSDGCYSNADIIDILLSQSNERQGLYYANASITEDHVQLFLTFLVNLVNL